MPQLARLSETDQQAQASALRDLRRIPGVGKSIAIDLWDLGVRSVAQLDGADPEDMYERLCMLRGQHIDRCMLYTLRCAVYFAGPGPHDPDLLKWWNWKDTRTPQPEATASA